MTMTNHQFKRRSKLIEIAIPIEAINEESSRRKRKAPAGFPTSFHKWWAQRPSAAAFAILACQLIDDPSSRLDDFPTQEAQEDERKRLFSLISSACLWENRQNHSVLDSVKQEIRSSWDRFLKDNKSIASKNENSFEDLPPFIDPFSGGGIIPLEAQRLGLVANARDLNPIPVLIGKGLIEFPALLDSPYLFSLCQILTGNFAGSSRASLLADVIQHYGKNLSERVSKKISNIYPNIYITDKMLESQPELKSLAGSTCTPAAWVWARTVPSPNPGFCNIAVPLMASSILSSRKGKKTWVDFKISENSYFPQIHRSDPPSFASKGTKVGRGANFKCILSGDLITPEYIKQCSKTGKLQHMLIATVVDTPLGRVFMPPSEDQLQAATGIQDSTASAPGLSISGTSQYMGVMCYGMNNFSQLFTKRQAYSLSTIHTEINNIYHDIVADLEESTKIQGAEKNDELINKLGIAIISYLTIASNRVLHFNSTACTWLAKDSAICKAFPKQALQMSWDFSEGNILGKSSASLERCIKVVVNAVRMLPQQGSGSSLQSDARKLSDNSHGNKYIISTDPPYYDNVPYSDLADYFYLWTRSCLSKKLPELFPTMACPKADELVAFSYRHKNSKKEAADFFLTGMREALSQISNVAHPGYPTTIYYAFKQSESSKEGEFSSTGWETFLDAVISSGLTINTIWPLRTEGDNRQRGVGSNALATSIVLVCSRKDENAKPITKIEFRRKLRTKLPGGLSLLERLNIPPVDIAQAAIGNGMSVFSKASHVLHQDDSLMSVREALIEINLALDECLSCSDDKLDADTRFALTFFESYGYEERPYGDAEGLAVARNVSVQGVAEAGILSAIAGKAQLLRREQLEDEWVPSRDDRLCVWEATQHLIRALDSGGEASAAALLTQLKNLPGQGELAANCRALAYRLYNHCEKTKKTEEARAYNGLVIAWPELQRLATSKASASAVQTSLI